MPITSELENRRKLKAVGFTDEQADVLVEVMGRSRLRGVDRFEEAVNRAVFQFRADMRARSLAIAEKTFRRNVEFEFGYREFRSCGDSFRRKIRDSIRQQTRAIGWVLVVVWSIAVAIIKLFPNWY